MKDTTTELKEFQKPKSPMVTYYIALESISKN